MKYLVLNIMGSNKKNFDRTHLPQDKSLEGMWLEILADDVQLCFQRAMANVFGAVGINNDEYLQKIKDFDEKVYGGYIIIEVNNKNRIRVVGKKRFDYGDLVNKLANKKYSERLCKKYGMELLETFDDEDTAKLYLEVSTTK